MADEGKGLVEVAAELHELRERYRQADAEAKRVPALRSEVERLKAEVARQRLRAQEARGEAAELDASLRAAKQRVARMEELEKENALLSTTLQIQRVNSEDQEGKMRRLAEEYSSLEAELLDAKLQIGQLKEEQSKLDTLRALGVIS